MLILMKTRSAVLEMLDANRRREKERDDEVNKAHLRNFRCERAQIYQMAQLYHTVMHV
jgi:hypothetical protein